MSKTHLIAQSELGPLYSDRNRGGSV